MSGCRIQANKLNGVLAREDTQLELRDGSVSGNGEFGIYLKVRFHSQSGYCAVLWLFSHHRTAAHADT